MIRAIRKKITHYWSNWARERALLANPQRLDSRNLYILPSRLGWAYALVLLTLFLCAINYQVSSVFFLTFLLAVAGMVSAFEAHYNLKSLSVSCVEIDDAYEDGAVQVVLFLTVERSLSYALEYHFINQDALKLEKLNPAGTKISLGLAVKKRGCFQLPRITFSSDYPLGLFRVWGYVYLNTDYYVYPQRVSPGFWPKSWIDSGDNPSKIPGNEEIYDLKQVINPWIQPSRIAWKIAARGQGWYLKTMVNSEGDYWLFRIQDLPYANLEQNLQHLCYWLTEAEQRGSFYGLELNGVSTNLSQGSAHLTHCLRQLATY